MRLAGRRVPVRSRGNNPVLNVTPLLESIPPERFCRIFLKHNMPVPGNKRRSLLSSPAGGANRMQLPLYDPDFMPSTIELNTKHVLPGESSQWHKHATKVNRFMF